MQQVQAPRPHSVWQGKSQQGVLYKAPSSTTGDSQGKCLGFGGKKTPAKNHAFFCRELFSFWETVFCFLLSPGIDGITNMEMPSNHAAWASHHEWRVSWSVKSNAGMQHSHPSSARQGMKDGACTGLESRRKQLEQCLSMLGACSNLHPYPRCGWQGLLWPTDQWENWACFTDASHNRLAPYFSWITHSG